MFGFLAKRVSKAHGAGKIVPLLPGILSALFSWGVVGRGLAQTQADWNNAIDADRPDLANSARALDPGIFQVEVGLGETTDSKAGSMAYSFPLALRAGAVENLEFRLLTRGPQWMTSGQKGDAWTALQDLNFGAKWTLYDQDGNPLEAVGFLGGADFQDLGNGPALTQANLTLALNFNLPEGTGLGVNGGCTANPYDGGQKTWDYAGSFGFPLRGHWSGYLEASGALPDVGNATFGLDGGFKCLLKPDEQFDISIGRFWAGSDAQTEFSVGLSFRTGAKPKAGDETRKMSKKD